MNDSLAPVLPWHKRHPVLSRALLYSVGLAVVIGVVLLRRGREETDRQDRLNYLSSRLDGFDVVLVQDPTGEQVLGALDEEFSAPDLDPGLRGRALRVRAFALVKGERVEEALAALDEALALAATPLERVSVQIERGLILSATDAAEEALDLLAALSVPRGESVLALWLALGQTQALLEIERPADALAVLESAIEAQPRPLPGGPARVLAVTRWVPKEAAFHATLMLTDPRLPDSGVAPWLRLLDFCPHDFDAAAQAARQLLEMEKRPEAAMCWARASALNPERAAHTLEGSPRLRELADFRDEGLKTTSEGGR